MIGWRRGRRNRNTRRDHATPNEESNVAMDPIEEPMDETRPWAEMTQTWKGTLSHYHRHCHGEHVEALVQETADAVAQRLRKHLSASPYWSEVSDARLVAVLLYLVDRGALRRVRTGNGIIFEAQPDAEDWARAQTGLKAKLGPILDLIAAVRASGSSHSQA